MKCGKCSDCIDNETECVVCSTCAVKFHFDCSVREVKWRNMSMDQKKKWVCYGCKPGSGSGASLTRVNSNSTVGSVEDVVTPGDEDVNMKALLLKINTRLDTLDDVKKTVDGMSTSLEFLSGKYDELLEEVRGYRDSTKELRKEVESLKSKCDQKDGELKELIYRFNVLDQYGRGINLEIHNLEEDNMIDLDTVLNRTAKALELTYRPSDIQAVHRLPSRDTERPRKLLVQFVSRATKRLWLVQGRKKRLRSKDILGSSDSRLYFNENLTPYYNRLLWETKKTAREKKYEFVWVANGIIRVKKTQASRQVLVISSAEDLKQLV